MREWWETRLSGLCSRGPDTDLGCPTLKPRVPLALELGRGGSSGGSNGFNGGLGLFGYWLRGVGPLEAGGGMPLVGGGMPLGVKRDDWNDPGGLGKTGVGV